MKKTVSSQGSGVRTQLGLQIVSPDTWEASLAKLRRKEKAATRARDALAAERRRLPAVKISGEYRFATPDGERGLVDLFDGRRQLIVYHFMFEPDEDEGCAGCSMFVDNLGHLAHLHARDTSLVLISLAPLKKLLRYKKRMKWDIPWVSSEPCTFNRDFGVTTPDGESFGLSVFIREGNDVYRTYFTDGRGVEALGSNWTLLDLTPLGRQETWEDSPKGWPQSEPYQWWRRHDSYGARDEAEAR